MRYLSKNIDGSIAVITLVPVKVIQQEDGLEVTILGIRRNDPKEGRLGQCILYGSTVVKGQIVGVNLIIGDENFDIADLTETSLPGFTIVFPDVTEVIGKWVSGEQVVSHRKIEKHEIPEDRYFREAWTDTNGKLEVHMSKAREIHKDMLRALRKPLLEALDVAYIKADEEGLSSQTPNANLKKKQGIMAEKQRLRDITKHPDIEKATTPEELRAVVL